jgi:hypothetical protein
MSKISNNPSAKKLLDDIHSMRGLKALFDFMPFAKVFFPSVAEHLGGLEQLSSQAEILLVPDRFNDAFAQQGWIAYESMSLDAMMRALEIEKESGLATAEQYLSDHYGADTLEFGIKRCTGHAEFRKRLRLIELAKEDYLAGRYHACVPLLLSLIDGLVNDISKHVGFFADNINMTAWDSIAAHESGLSALAKIMGTGRNKTSENEITIPYRNGILHGRELAFDNKIVAAKCWAALLAVRDWAGALVDGKGEPKQKKENKWSDLFQQIAENERTKKFLVAWQPRTSAEFGHLPYSGPPSGLAQDTPERLAAEFLDNWCNARYGPMADAFLDYLNTPKGKKAGNAKRDFGNQTPASYRIVSTIDETPAISQVDIEIVFEQEPSAEVVQLSLRLVYSDPANDPLVWRHQKGNWKLIQNGFSKVIYRN